MGKVEIEFKSNKKAKQKLKQKSDQVFSDGSGYGGLSILSVNDKTLIVSSRYFPNESLGKWIKSDQKDIVKSLKNNSK